MPNRNRTFGYQNEALKPIINGIGNFIISKNFNLEKTLLLNSLFASIEQYISASTFDGKYPLAFKIGLMMFADSQLCLENLVMKLLLPHLRGHSISVHKSSLMQFIPGTIKLNTQKDFQAVPMDLWLKTN